MKAELLSEPGLPSRRPMTDAIHAGPVTDAERHHGLDVLRGLAVLGILLTNIQHFSMFAGTVRDPTLWGDLRGANFWVYALTFTLVFQKFLPIFAMLFGAGIVLADQHLQEQGRPDALPMIIFLSDGRFSGGLVPDDPGLAAAEARGRGVQVLALDIDVRQREVDDRTRGRPLDLLEELLRLVHLVAGDVLEDLLHVLALVLRHRRLDVRFRDVAFDEAPLETRIVPDGQLIVDHGAG